MTYEYLKTLKSTHQTLKLINSDNFAMSVSFFHKAFVQGRESVLPQNKILQLLEDYLFALEQSYAGVFSRSAQAYLDDFAKSGYLRKYYADADEPLYELTPHTQRALEWIEGLRKREFVGSRSRFNIIFELLEELEFETSLDDEARISKLEKKKCEIDEQIEAIRNRQALRFDDARIKEHYMQIEEIARRLKYDFSEIEYNFRKLNQTAMEQIAMRDDAKGEILGSIFELEDNIRGSDQGRSFFAFWQLLTDGQRSEKLTKMLENLYSIETVKHFDPQKRLQHLKYDLLDSGEKISMITSRLVEQLRRFIDDRVWIENRRILQLCKNIEKQALSIKEIQPKVRRFTTLPGSRVSIASIASKALYTPKTKTHFSEEIVIKESDVDLESFYHQCYIDETLLRHHIDTLLQEKAVCTLAEVVERFGVDKGVAELIGYLSIAKSDNNTSISYDKAQRIEVYDFDGNKKLVTLPKIIFTGKNR